MFSLDWKSHAINTNIVEIFIKTNHSDELFNFYRKKLAEEDYDMEFRGHTQLNLAQAYSLINDKNQMSRYVSDAKESFLICYDNNHPIFGVLEKMLR